MRQVHFKKTDKEKGFMPMFFLRNVKNLSAQNEVCKGT